MNPHGVEIKYNSHGMRIGATQHGQPISLEKARQIVGARQIRVWDFIASQLSMGPSKRYDAHGNAIGTETEKQRDDRIRAGVRQIHAEEDAKARRAEMRRLKVAA